MANYTRSNGANARAPEWDDFEEEAPQRTGSWLPLEALEEEPYLPGPLRAVQPAPRQSRAERPESKAAPRRHKTQDAGPKAARGRLVALFAGGALCALAVYAAISAAVEWTQIKLDDVQYGRPRTAQIDAFVGHGEGEGVPSHFIAMNLNRRVTVIELPGGDSAKATTIAGPYLFGANEDLTPVQVGSQDINGDGKPDLLVTAKNEQLIYLNDGAAFKLITPDQQASLRKAQAGSASGPANGATAPQEAGK